MAVPQHPAENEYFHDFSDDLLGKTRAPLEEMPSGTFQSSNVHSALYDFGQRELFIRYLRDVGPDAVYQYTNVPAKTWQGLVAAGSKGSYVNAEIAYEFNYAKVGRDEMMETGRNLQQGTVRRFLLTP
jgi:hypothetical protein